MPALCVAQKISKSVSGKPLFDQLTISVEENERLAILGANGSGKSTLLRILSGLDHADDGSLTGKRDLRVAYVAQQDVFADAATIRSTLESVLDPSDPAREAKISRYLGKFGFSDPGQSAAELSGGWKKRLALARGFIQEADLLLLDEPTNHLDISGIEWLEEQLQELRCSIVFVSHDRYFIETLASRVIELDRRYPNGSISSSGTYSDFLSYRQDFLAQLQKAQNSLANKVRREVEWLRQGAKARTTKSKHRTAEALKLIDQLQGMRLESNKVNFDFLTTGKRSKELLKAETISKAFGGRKLFENFSVILSPGSRLGVAGDNGSGKSTLLNVLIGNLKSDSGRVLRANNLRISFFDQARKSLNPEMSLQEALIGDAKSIVVNGREYAAPAWAMKFLFSPHQLSVPVGKLSGGEQARVLVARIMRDPADILVLDEPTNDLDIATLEVIEESLEEFPGAIIVVTHDRFLLDRISTQIAGLLGNGRIELFSSYLQWEIAKEQSDKRVSRPTSSEASVGSRAKGVPSGKMTYAERLELGKLPEKIEKAEARIAKLQEEVVNPEIAADAEKLKKICIELDEAQERVNQLMSRWEELESK